MFERWYRVQLNTLEQLVVFLPALFLFANYASPRLAGWIGLAFVVGRIVYARSYLADPAARGPGFIIGFSANSILVRRRAARRVVLGSASNSAACP